MKCPYCGAEASAARGECEYCGAAVDAPKTPENVSRDAVFERVVASEEYARRDSPERHAALPSIPAIMQVVPAIFLVGFICVGGFMALMALSMTGLVGAVGFSVHPAGGLFGLVGLMFALVPVGFVVLGVFLLKKHFEKMRSFGQAPIEGEAVIIVGKRTAVSGGGRNSSASTAYFLTVEFPDGRREEFATLTPGLYAKVAEDDAGVLFIRDRLALDFDRV